MEKKVGRIIILREICDAKDTLFGPFSSDRTMHMKLKLWTNIVDKAKTLGLVAACKDYKYMRDVYWQNIKRHSMAKRENLLKYGKKFKKTPIDELVFEIVDNTSNLHTQTNIKEHLEYNLTSANPTVHHTVLLKTDEECKLMNEDVDVTIEEIDYLKVEPPFIEEEQVEEQDYLEESQVDEQVHDPQKYEKSLGESPSKVKTNGPLGTLYGNDILNQRMEEASMKKKREQFEIELLELKNYKMKLEVLELERKLGLEPSKFTEKIAKRGKTYTVVYKNNDDDDDDGKNFDLEGSD